MTCVVERLPTRQVRTHAHTMTQKPATLSLERGSCRCCNLGFCNLNLRDVCAVRFKLTNPAWCHVFLGMTYHKRTEHFEEKPFSCEDCGAKFGANSSLKNHMRLHTGEKPYRCKHCDMSFTVAAALAYHTKKKHSEGNSHAYIFH